jgi:hypothetical protein
VCRNQQGCPQISEIISASEEEIVSSGSVAGTIVTTANTAIYNETELHSKSSGSE